MPGIDLLVQLARRELEEHRRALRQLDAALAEQRSQLQALARALGAELETASAAERLPPTLAPYLAACHGRQRRLRARVADLETERRAELARIVERRLGLKRLELLQDRRRARAAREARRREQRGLDEVAGARFWRARSAATQD